MMKVIVTTTSGERREFIDPIKHGLNPPFYSVCYLTHPLAPVTASTQCEYAVFANALSSVEIVQVEEGAIQ